MGTIAGVNEPGGELGRLIADLPESGLLVFVFGVGWWTAHLTGATVPVFRGPAGRRWWHVELGDGNDGARMRPERLEAWQALRERYGNRGESRVDHGTLLAAAA